MEFLGTQSCVDVCSVGKMFRFGESSLAVVKNPELVGIFSGNMYNIQGDIGDP